MLSTGAWGAGSESESEIRWESVKRRRRDGTGGFLNSLEETDILRLPLAGEGGEDGREIPRLPDLRGA